MADALPVLAPDGAYVMAGDSMPRFFQAMVLGSWLTSKTAQTVKCLASSPNQADLIVLKETIEAGQITPVVDRTYPLSEVPDVIRNLETRQVQDKVYDNFKALFVS